MIGAGPHERTETRTAQRNGARPRTLTTTAGDLVNRRGIDGGFQPPKDGSHGGTEEVPRELRERGIRFALDLVEGPEQLSVNAACRLPERVDVNGP